MCNNKYIASYIYGYIILMLTFCRLVFEPILKKPPFFSAIFLKAKAKFIVIYYYSIIQFRLIIASENFVFYM